MFTRLLLLCAAACLLTGGLAVAAARALGMNTGDLLLFESTRGGAFDTYLLDPDRALVWPLPVPGVAADAVWSPDGSAIAYAGTNGGATDLYVLNMDTLAARRVAAWPGSETAFAWSPDGREIAFVGPSAQRSDVFIADVAAGQVRSLTGGNIALPLSRGNYHFAPVWSPDGTQIAYRASADGRPGPLFVASRDGATVRRMAENASNLSPMLWTAAGIVFEQNIPGTFNQNLALLNPATGSLTTLTASRGGQSPYNARPSVSMAGERLAFVSRVSLTAGQYELFTLRLGEGTGGLIPLGIAANTYTSSSWSRAEAGGLWLAYDFAASGASGIYRVAVHDDGTPGTPQRLTSNALDLQPGWRP